MKKFFSIIACAMLMLLASCSTPQGAVNKLVDLKNDVKQNSVDYTMKDWKKCVKNYEDINYKIEKYALKGEYTPAQMTEIGKLQGETAAEMAKGAGGSLLNKAVTVGSNVKGLIEGFKSALGL